MPANLFPLHALPLNTFCQKQKNSVKEEGEIHQNSTEHIWILL